MEFRVCPGCRFPNGDTMSPYKTSLHHRFADLAKLSNKTSTCYRTAMGIRFGGGWGRFLRSPCYTTAKTSSFTTPHKPDYTTLSLMQQIRTLTTPDNVAILRTSITVTPGRPSCAIFFTHPAECIH